MGENFRQKNLVLVKHPWDVDSFPEAERSSRPGILANRNLFPFEEVLQVVRLVGGRLIVDENFVVVWNVWLHGGTATLTARFSIKRQ